MLSAMPTARSPPCRPPPPPGPQVEYVLQKAGAKGQLAIIGFLVVLLIVLIFLLIA